MTKKILQIVNGMRIQGEMVGMDNKGNLYKGAYSWSKQALNKEYPIPILQSTYFKSYSNYGLKKQ